MSEKYHVSSDIRILIQKDETNEYHIVKYNGDGTPTYVNNSSEFAYSSCKGYYIEDVQSDLTFKLPVIEDTLPSKKLYYAITYNDIRVPTTWNSTDVQGSGDSGYIENIIVEKSKITSRYTFLFVWYKDELGNICVHNLPTTEKNSRNQHLYINWWTVKTNGQLPSVSMQSGYTDRPQIDFIYQNSSSLNSSLWTLSTPTVSLNTQTNTTSVAEQLGVSYIGPLFEDNTFGVITDSIDNSKKSTKTKNSKKKSKKDKSESVAQKLADSISTEQVSSIKEVAQTKVQEEIKSIQPEKTFEVAENIVLNPVNSIESLKSVESNESVVNSAKNLTENLTSGTIELSSNEQVELPEAQLNLTEQNNLVTQDEASDNSVVNLRSILAALAIILLAGSAIAVILISKERRLQK